MATRAIHFCRIQHLRRRKFTFEWSRKTHGWSSVPELEDFMREFKDDLFFVEVDGCRVGCKDPWTGETLSKGWSLLTNDENVWRKLNLKCNHTEKHARVQGRNTRTTAYYLRTMIKLAVDCFMMEENFGDLMS